MARIRRSEPYRPTDLGVQYTRYSTELQGSTREQQAINEEVAEDAGVALVRHFKDESLSRSLSDRPGLLNLFAYLETHPEVGFIVVNELERLTAGIDQRHQVTRLCKQHRITILTEDIGPVDPHDRDKMQEADARAVASKGEVLKVARRTRRNLRAKVKAKTIVAMRPPYGVRMRPLVTPDGQELPSGVSMLDASGKKVTSGVIEPHPEEYPWLVEIFNWAAEGVSLNEICRRLMAKHVPTKTGRARWDSTTVRGILDNPLYKGELLYGRRQTLEDEDGTKYAELRDADDPRIVRLASPLGPLVEPEVWERVRRRRNAARGTRQANPRTLDQQVFDHRVFCGRCGHKMYGRADQKKSGGYSWRYLCLSSYGSTSYAPVPGFAQPCTTGHSISLKDLLGALAGKVGGYGSTVYTLTAVRDNGSDDVVDQQERLEAEIEVAESQYKNAQRLGVHGLMELEDVAQHKAARDATVAEATAALELLAGHRQVDDVPLTGYYRASLTELADGLADESTEVSVRRALLDDIGLDRIYVDKPRVRLHFR